MAMERVSDGMLVRAEGADRGEAVLAQMRQGLDDMHHIDELFTRVAHALVQSSGVAAVQFWVLEGGTQSQQLSLRVSAFGGAALPRKLLVNTYVAQVAEGLCRARRSTTLWAVRELFSPHHALLLARHGVNYCSGYFLASTVPAPLERCLGTPVALLFLRHFPRQQVLTFVERLVQQALPLAIEGRLVLFPSGGTPIFPCIQSRLAQPVRSLPPAELIPRRNEQVSWRLWLAALAVGQRSAWQIYNAIDGKKTVGELALLTGLSLETTLRELKALHAQRRVLLSDSQGRLVDPGVLNVRP